MSGFLDAYLERLLWETLIAPKNSRSQYTDSTEWIFHRNGKHAPFTDENFIFTNYSLNENQIRKNFDQNTTRLILNQF